jgi:uncharacterized membrane protein required for colicin V production
VLRQDGGVLKELISKLTWVDYLALIALLRGLYVGYKSGVFHELLRVAAYVVTILATLFVFEPAAQYLTLHTFLNIESARAVGFIGALVLIYLLTKVVRMVLVKLLKPGPGSAMNGMIGAVIGSVRLLVLLSFVFMGIDHSPLSQLRTDIHTRSLTGPKIAEAAPVLVEFMSHLSLNAAPKPEK